MSIASELTALNGHILDSYTAVNNKGGTVPANKNMVNLPTAIASISGGGGGGGDGYVQPRLTSYDRNTGVLTGTNLGTSGTVYVFDRMQNKGVAVATSSWSDTSITLSAPVDLANLTGTTSIWVVPTGGIESTKLMLYGDIEVTGYGTLYYTDNNGDIQTATMTSGSIGSSTYGWSITLNGVTIWNDQIVGVQPGASLTSIGDNFLYNCYNFNQPLDLSNVTSIGTYFLSTCTSFDQPLDLSGITSISDYFLNSCYSFNQPLDLSNVTSIGSRFLNACYGFNQPLTLGSATCGVYFMYQCYSFTQLDVGSSTISSNNYSLSGSSNMTRMYVEGVTLTGANASTWKSTLANRTNSPYRKLIDGTV